MWLCFIFLLFCTRRIGRLAVNSLGYNMKLVTIIQILISLHFVNIYKGTLLSAYLLKPMEPSLDIIDHAIRRVERGEIALIVPSNGLTFKMIEAEDLPIFLRLRKTLIDYPPIAYQKNRELAGNLLNHNQAVYLSMSAASHFTLLKNNCHLHSLELKANSQYTTYKSIVVRKDLTALTAKLNRAMDETSLVLKIPKIIQRYYKQIDHQQHKCQSLEMARQKAMRAVTLTNLSGPIILLVGVCCISTIVFVGEKFMYLYA